MPSRASSSSTRAAQRAMVRREPHGERPWSGARTAAAGGTPPRAGPAAEPGEGAAWSPRPGPELSPPVDLPARAPGRGGDCDSCAARGSAAAARPLPAVSTRDPQGGLSGWPREAPPRFLSRVPRGAADAAARALWSQSVCSCREPSTGRDSDPSPLPRQGGRCPGWGWGRAVSLATVSSHSSNAGAVPCPGAPLLSECQAWRFYLCMSTWRHFEDFSNSVRGLGFCKNTLPSLAENKKFL